MQSLNLKATMAPNPAPSVSLESIVESTRRLPFSKTDESRLIVQMEIANRNGLDLQILNEFAETAEMLRGGILLLQSKDLETDFVFVSVDAGRGFFGGQKLSVLTYTSDIYRNSFFSGPVLGSLLRALIGINNIYRNAGILKGAAR